MIETYANSLEHQEQTLKNSEDNYKPSGEREQFFRQQNFGDFASFLISEVDHVLFSEDCTTLRNHL